MRYPTLTYTACFIAALSVAASQVGYAASPAPAPELTASLTKSEIARYRAAFSAAAAGKWRLVEKHRAKGGRPLLDKALAWYRYKAPRSGASFHQIAAFIAADPEWPSAIELRSRAEEAMDANVPAAEILSWFERYPPLTAPGSTRFARALIETKQTDRAREFIRDAWVRLNMSRHEARAFRREFRKYLRSEDHIQRLDRLIWDQRVGAAQRQMRLVGRDYQHLAQARLMLMRRTGGVDGAIARVPEAMRSDPGLVYERLRWRRRKGFTDKAIELLDNPPAQLERPDKWWFERSVLTRRALRNGEVTRAYRLARDHRQTDGASFAEGEWLAGWIALRFLHDPDVAFGHFERLYGNVQYPISRARGAYWAGRAAEASNGPLKPQAGKWYGEAAKNVTTFYGQLAHIRLPNEAGPQSEPVADSAQRAVFERREVVQLIRMLAALEESELAEDFLASLMRDQRHPAEWSLVAGLARDMDRMDLSVRVAKNALRDGVLLSEAGYPALTGAVSNADNAALIHAVIRQESAFDAAAVSRAGARGLMQLMPATAKSVAKQLKIKHSRSRLTSDPSHNINLGSAYLNHLIDVFDGSVVLALAAYNAGPHRVRRWLRTNGDPRATTIQEAIDWVEGIPIAETRNYVQRVLENLPIYGFRLQERYSPTLISDALTKSHRDGSP